MRFKEEIAAPWHPRESTWELERWGRVGNGQELRFDKVRHPEKSLQIARIIQLRETLQELSLR